MGAFSARIIEYYLVLRWSFGS